MALGYNKDLYLLAFDHRGSFQKKMFGISGTPTAEETTRIIDAKKLIFEGFVAARNQAKLGAEAGILVDEQFGTDVARQAKSMGVVLAMPAESSGKDEFDFDYGDDFGKHIETFDPSFCKVLVRFNPDDDAALNSRQLVKLKQLNDWLKSKNRKFLFELLVPATKDQLAKAGGKQDTFDQTIRPNLVIQCIVTFQKAGIEADVWKIEGLDSRQDCERVAQQARSGGRDEVICVVLGRGADQPKVDHWLKAGAGVPGYRGFAIGRTIWWDALAGYRDKKLERGAAAALIAKNYLHAIEVYRGKAG